MISLNILSPAKKEAAERQLIILSIQYFFSCALIAICVVGTILLITKLIMQNSFDQAVAQGALVTREYGVLNQRVYLENQKIKFLTAVQKDFITWSPTMAAITALTPKNIELYSISVSDSSKAIKFSGQAITRDDLLFYKQQLESSPLLKKVSLPIENLLEAEKVNFDITAELTF